MNEILSGKAAKVSLVLLAGVLGLIFIGKGQDLADKWSGKIYPQKTMAVTSEGKVKAIPDLATVSLGVVTQGANPANVQAENSEKIKKIVEFVKSVGVNKDDISTSQFNIYPQYDYTNGKNLITGYQLNQSIVIKIKQVDKSTEALNKVLRGSLEQGANQIDGVTLGFEDPDAMKMQAQKLAIEKAKAKAQDLAKVSGLKIGKVVNIAENYTSNFPMPYMDYGKGGGGGSSGLEAGSPNIQPGQQDLVETVTVTFEVK